jgi:hypothetical protein
VTELTWFCTAVGFTVAFLTVVVITGLRGQITVHIPCVVATIASLALAIVYAVKLGQIYDLESAGAIYPIHMGIARVAALSYVLPVYTGIRTLFKSSHRRAHFWCAMVVLVMTAAASITGTWMLLAAELRPAG